MSKEVYVPLSELDSRRIHSDLKLPFQLENKIGINVKKVERLAQLSGLRYVIIRNDPDGETTKTQSTIVGMNNDGSAVSGGMKVDYAPTSDMKMNQDKSDSHNSRWADVSIILNTEEIKQRLLYGNKVVTKAAPWAAEIDDAINKEIRKAGNRQLLEVTSVDKLTILWIYGWNTISSINLALNSHNIGIFGLSFLSQSVVAGTAFNFITSRFEGSESQGKGSRLTLMVGPEIDRAVIFNMALLGKPLVTDLS